MFTSVAARFVCSARFICSSMIEESCIGYYYAKETIRDCTYDPYRGQKLRPGAVPFRLSMHVGKPALRSELNKRWELSLITSV